MMSMGWMILPRGGQEGKEKLHGPIPGSEIQRALPLFHGLARYAMRINHRRPDVRVPEHFLDRANIIIRLQEVRCERVAKGVSSYAFGSQRQAKR